jgi:hypothetical protein
MDLLRAIRLAVRDLARQPGYTAATVVTLALVIGDLLFGVEPIDLTTYFVVMVLVLAVVTAASWLPAHRAATIEPLALLKRPNDWRESQQSPGGLSQLRTTSYVLTINMCTYVPIGYRTVAVIKRRSGRTARLRSDCCQRRGASDRLVT